MMTTRRAVSQALAASASSWKSPMPQRDPPRCGVVLEEPLLAGPVAVCGQHDLPVSLESVAGHPRRIRDGEDPVLDERLGLHG